MKSIRQFVVRSLIGLLATFGTLFLFTVYEMNQYVDKFSFLEKQSLSTSAQIRLLDSNFKTQIQEWKNVLLRGHILKDRFKYWQRFLENEQRLTQELQALTNHQELNLEVSRLLTQYQDIMSKYKSSYSSHIEEQFDVHAADQSVRGLDRNISMQMTALVKKIDNSIDNELIALEQQANEVELVILVFGLTVSGLSLFLVIRRLNKNVIDPLIDVTALNHALSLGNYSLSVSYSSDNEVGQLAQSSRVLKEKMSEAVNQVTIVDSEVRVAFEKLTAASREIANGAEIQNQVVDNLNAAVVELNEMAAKNKNESQQARKTASNTNANTEDCFSLVRDTNKGMEQLVTEMTAINQHIEKLEQDSKEIVTVLEVIQSIAEQTNLLALNAAIEAARAGEHGRGFSVVADEVRSLASRTQTSTIEIQQIIENLQKGSKEAVDSISIGLNKTEQNAQLCVTTQAKLQEIVSAVAKLSDTINIIDESAVQQESIATSMYQGMESLTNLSEKLKSLSDSDEVSNAVQVASSDLQKLVERLLNKETSDSSCELF